VKFAERGCRLGWRELADKRKRLKILDHARVEDLNESMDTRILRDYGPEAFDFLQQRLGSLEL
jgi:hypothetical protein